MNDILEMQTLDDVLLVDDDELSVMLTSLILKNSKQVRNIQVSQDGLEALDFIKSSLEEEGTAPYQLILLDLNMPVMDGWEFLRQYAMLKESNKQLPPVAILTSSIQNEDIQRSKQYPEVLCFVSKPFSYQSFAHIMGTLSA